MPYAHDTCPFAARLSLGALANGTDASLAVEVDALGPVRYIVAPNTLHYVFVQDWKARFPGAEVFAAPGLEQSARQPVPDHRELDDVAPDDWADVMRQIVVSSRSFSEACFFHIPTRTLILTDLIGSFELDRVRSPFVRFFLKRGGCVHPHGKTPLDIRLGLRLRRRHVGSAVQRMIDWAPERVILAHGKWYSDNAVAELKLAFEWAL